MQQLVVCLPAIDSSHTPETQQSFMGHRKASVRGAVLSVCTQVQFDNLKVRMAGFAGLTLPDWLPEVCGQPSMCTSASHLAGTVASV